MGENSGHSREDCKFKEKIESLDEKVNDLNNRVSIIENKDSYSGQQLYEMIRDLQSDISSFNQTTKHNNELMEQIIAGKEENTQKIDSLNERVNKIETKEKTEEETKDKTNNSWKYWIHYIIDFLLFILYLKEAGVI